MRFIKNTFIIGFAALLLSCAGAAKKYETGIIPKAVAPNGVEIAKTRNLLKKSAAASKGKVKLYASGPHYNRAKRIVNRLAKAAGLRGFSYPVYIADDGKTINAMAVNDNTIVIYKKLMDQVPTDAKLSVIMAHEVAHILKRHGSDRVLKTRSAAVAIGSAILGAVVAANTGSADSGAAVRDISGMIGAGTVLTPYTRSMELEADHVGMLLMAKAGYNPQEAIGFWKNSRRYLGATGPHSFLSTHPAPANRQAKLQETLPLALNYYKK